MTAKTPAYAKIKPITSLSGMYAVRKHLTTLERAQALLEAQGTPEGVDAARALNSTMLGYLTALQVFYRSEHYPYRRDAV